MSYTLSELNKIAEILVSLDEDDREYLIDQAMGKGADKYDVMRKAKIEKAIADFASGKRKPKPYKYTPPKKIRRS